MNCITKATTSPRPLKVHVHVAGNKTLCGLLLDPAQFDLAEANCKRCARCQRARITRRHIRGTVRLNGKRVSANQIKLIP